MISDPEPEPTQDPNATPDPDESPSATVSHTHIRKLFLLCLLNILYFILFSYNSSVLTRTVAYVMLDIRVMIVLKDCNNHCKRFDRPLQVTPRQVLVIQRQQIHTSVSHVFPFHCTTMARATCTQLCYHHLVIYTLACCVQKVQQRLQRSCPIKCSSNLEMSQNFYDKLGRNYIPSLGIE